MEEQCFTYYFQQEGFEDFKHSLFYSTLELEEAILSSHEEISRKDEEIAQLKCILAKIIKEKDEFQSKCQQLALDKHLLLQLHVQVQSPKQSQQCHITSSNTTSDQDENHGDTDDNITSGVASGCRATLPLSQPDVIDKILIGKSLPEKGKLLKAVMEAGPLLQTLLLAGPLPQWQHPPPQLKCIDIPPVSISSPTAATKILHQDACLTSPSGRFSNKRTMVNMENLDLSPNPKHQKVCSPIIIDSNI